MKLTDLRISLKTFGRDEGKYNGKAEFSNSNGDVAIKLTPEMCDKIFMVCADGIVDVAKEAAANLTCNVIEHKESLAELDKE